MATGAAEARQQVQSLETEQDFQSDPRNLDEQIRERAHEIWLAHDGGVGSDVTDWLQAEQEVLAR